MRIAKRLMVVLCLLLLISSAGSLVILDYQQPGGPERSGIGTEEYVPRDAPDEGQVGISNPITDDMTTLFEAGSYKTNTDIPAGLYVAFNDGSAVSKVTVRDSQEARTDDPRIIVTSRYVTNRGEFTDRSNYVEAIRRGGGEPIQPDDDLDLAVLLREGLVDNADSLAERYDGLLLTGGGDIAAHFFDQEHHPAANPPDIVLDTAELALCRAFINAGKPVLGICRGMQILNVATGGDLIQDIPDILDIPVDVHLSNTARHDITIRRGSWLYSMFGPEIETNSLHHQSLGVIAAGFTVVAYTGPVIEAFERGNLLGVQFHPERMLGEGMVSFFEEFIYRCSFDNITIDIFTTHTIINIQDNQYIDVEGAYLKNIEDTAGMFDERYDESGYYPQGAYLVGVHIPEGRYRLAVAGDAAFSSFMVFENSSYEALLQSGTISDDGIFVELEEGQIIKLIYSTMS